LIHGLEHLLLGLAHVLPHQLVPVTHVTVSDGSTFKS
jgi:hypothetical protein